MSSPRRFGLEKRDGHEIGRDPRGMSREDLHRAGHKPLSPMKALRLKCLDCCNGSALEVRLCTAVACPIWPFRMGRNPWRKPMSVEQRARRAEQMRCNRAAALISAGAPLKIASELSAL